MRFRLRRAVYFVVVPVLALAAACERGRPAGILPVHPVEGRVLFKGKPLAGAQVTAHPVDEAKFGEFVARPTGQTDDEGRFRLMTYTRDDGAPVGTYLVSIAGLARPQSEGSLFQDPTTPVAKADVLQGRYLNPKTTGLKLEVKEGKNVLPPIELK